MIPWGLFRNRFQHAMHMGRIFAHDFMAGYTGSYGAYNALGLTAVDHARGFYNSWRNEGFRNALSGLRSFPGDVWGLIRGGWDTARGINTLGGWTGFASGVGLPMIAGSAIYSGLSNIRRGRYGSGLMRLIAGSALTYGLYKAYNYSNAHLSNTPNPRIPANDLEIPAFLRRGSSANVNNILNAVHEAQGGNATAESHVNVGIDADVAGRSLFAFKQFIR